MDQLQGRVAVVTGGGSGIGAGLARVCAAEGMKVVVADIEQAPADRVVQDLKAQGAEAIGVATDVSDRASVERLADRAYEAYGAVHLLFNNAGVMSLAPFLETTDGDWEWMFGVNFWGVVHGLRTFLPRMQQQGGPAHVVNTASLAGVVPIEGFQGIIYTATKYGVVAVSEKLRQELAGTGIDVSVVCPGGVATGIFTAERNRPPQYGGPSNVTPQSAQLAEGADERVAQMKSGDEVARIILDGVRANKLYIFTHANEREDIEKRFQHMLADIEGVPE